MPVYSRPPPDFGIAEEVVGVAHGLAEQDAVSAGASGAHQERAHVLQRQGAAHNGGQFLADFGVLPIAGLAAAGRLVEHLLVDGGQFVVGVLVALGHVGVLAALAGGAALVAGTPADHAGDYLVTLVGVRGFDVLDDQAAGVLALLFLHVQHALHAVDGIAGAQDAKELPVVAGKEAVDAGQAPAGAARPVAHIGGAGMADDAAVLGVGGVFLVAEQWVGVADAVDEVEHGVQVGLADVLLGAHPHANHGAGGGEGFVGNAALHFGQGFDDLLLGLLLRHCALSSPTGFGGISKMPMIKISATDTITQAISNKGPCAT